MPDISYLAQMQNQINQQGRQDVQDIGTNIGNIFTRKDTQDFRKAATDYFLSNDATVENVKNFLSMYPNKDPQEIFQIASAVESQKKSQTSKDLGLNLARYIKGGGDTSAAGVQSFMSQANMTPDEEKVFMEKMFPQWQNIFKDEFVSVGRRGLMNQKTKEIIGAPGEEAPDTPFKAAYKEKKGKINPETNMPYTVEEIIAASKEDKTPAIPYEIETPLEGNTIQKMGWNPQTQTHDKKVGKPYSRFKAAEGEKPEKPSRKAYRDTVTGAINYYDINNPKDRATLQKYGSQLQPIVGNDELQNLLQPLRKKASVKTEGVVKPIGVATPPINLLKEGMQTTFKNGQVWTLQNGKAVQLK